MKVLTLNTHSWMEKHPLEKLQQLAKQITTENYDLIALQEVNQRIDSQPVFAIPNFHPTDKQSAIHEDNFAYLLVQLLEQQQQTYHWSWTYNHIGYDLYHEGVALLSKQPLKPEAIVVSAEQDPTDYRRRVILIAQTTLGDHPVTAASCHYSWWRQTEGFSYEWIQTENVLKDYPAPYLLMGDFNNPASVKETGYDLVCNSTLQLQDSFLAAKETDGEFTVEKAIDGWGDNREQLRIDYIFTSPELSVQQYQIVFNGKQSPVISDHFGVAITIE
jgi:maltose 6'-phosphate phosphatase